MNEGRFHAAMALVCVAVAAFSLWGLPAAKIDVAMEPVLIRGLLLMFLLAVAGFYRWRQVERLANLSIMTFWAVLISNLHLFPMFIAARQKVPMSDALLAEADESMGMGLPAILSFMQDYPLLKDCLDLIYETLLLQLVAAILLPPLCNQMMKAKEFAVAGVVAAITGIAIFAVFQAEGPWIYYDSPVSHDQVAYGKVFAELKSDEWFTLDIAYREGLICFPSFHAALAVLAGWALWFNRYLRWPNALLSLAITVSTVTTGVHYVVDTLAGVLLAVISIFAARGYLWLESRWHRPPLLIDGCQKKAS